jgi:hypothetical protein
MSKIIYPRSPRETMCGWVHLPRFVDKLRLHLAGQLAVEYQENLTRGFDGRWLTAAGLDAATFIEVVKNSITDGEVADWVRKNVVRSEAEKAAFRDAILDYPKADDEVMQARLRMRKEQAGLLQRAEIKTFVDFIDADEGRL